MATHSTSPPERGTTPKGAIDAGRQKPDMIFIRNVAHLHSDEVPVALFLKSRTAVTVANPPKPCSHGPAPPALLREREPDLHQHRRREATTPPSGAKARSASSAFIDTKRLPLDWIWPAPPTSLRRHLHGGIAAIPSHGGGRKPAARQDTFLAGPSRRRRPHGQSNAAATAVLALYLQPPTSSAPQQDPANALAVPPLCLQTSTKQPTPPRQAHRNHQHHHGAQQQSALATPQGEEPKARASPPPSPAPCRDDRSSSPNITTEASSGNTKLDLTSQCTTAAAALLAAPRREHEQHVSLLAAPDREHEHTAALQATPDRQLAAAALKLLFPNRSPSKPTTATLKEPEANSPAPTNRLSNAPHRPDPS
uniref:Uncharacterized protein n=1 Tax=Aegilops tauschii subsp. strangulata TaxID=200361 RepID=A0A453ESJ3_AEGTS|nr:BUD13 homolog [Aegilops tauschii subsp. strangulata]